MAGTDRSAASDGSDSFQSVFRPDTGGEGQNPARAFGPRTTPDRENSAHVRQSSCRPARPVSSVLSKIRGSEPGRTPTVPAERGAVETHDPNRTPILEKSRIQPVASATLASRVTTSAKPTASGTERAASWPLVVLGD